MAEYIEKNHFDERIRIAVGMCEGDLTSDFKDGVLFVLNLLKSEENADVIPIPEGATNGDMIKAMFPDSTKYEFAIEDNLKIATMFVVSETSQVFYVHFDLDWWNAPYQSEVEE